MAKTKKESDITVYYACKVKREGVMECAMPSDGCRVTSTPDDAIQELFRREGLSLFDGVEFQTTTKKKKTVVHFPLSADTPPLPWAIALICLCIPVASAPSEVLEAKDAGEESIFLRLDELDLAQFVDESGSKKKDSAAMAITFVDVKEMDLEIVEAGNYAKIRQLSGKMRFNEDSSPLATSWTQAQPEDNTSSVTFLYPVH